MAHDDQPGDVRLPAAADVPDHSAGDVVGECVGTDEDDCDEIVTIDRSSMHFIADAAGIPRKKALVCEKHQSMLLEGVTLDLSIGGAHTRSDDFEQQREERSLFGSDDDADADADDPDQQDADSSSDAQG